MKTQIDKYKDLIVELLKKHEVKRASLFGSIVQGELTSESDFDLLVEFLDDKSLLDLVRLQIELDNFFLMILSFFFKIQLIISGEFIELKA